MSDAGGVRASDAERESAAAEIREHYAQGRIDDDELSERLERAYAARTRGELETIRADLPRLPRPAGDQRVELAARRSDLTRELLQQTGGALTPFLVCTVVWLLSGANGGFWPAWALLIAVVPLVRNGWRLYGPAPELDRVSRDLSRARRERDRSRRHR